MPQPARFDAIGFGDAGVYTAANHGGGAFGPLRLAVNDFGFDQGWRVEQHVRLFADLIGFNQGWRVDRHPLRLADVTGEGRVDLIGFGDGGVWVARNNGDGNFGPSQLVLADFGARSATDLAQPHVRACCVVGRSRR